MKPTPKSNKLASDRFKVLTKIKLRYYLLLGLLLLVIIGTNHYYAWAMGGLTTFFLAYVTKGSRKIPPHN